jgi:FMN phosphatase YigB (HAD superfamily)
MILPTDREGSDPARDSLAAQFLRSFEHLRGKPIALYGLGVNTYHLLNAVEGFNIVGLMDPENIGRRVFGLQVLSKDEAAARVKAIIIVARTAVVPIIYARIADLAAQQGIAIYDLGGNLLSSRTRETRRPWQAKPGSDEQTLRQAIADADVISFDVFDTLLMRQVARPENVFDLVEGRTRSSLGPDRFFKSERLAAERTVGEHCIAPTIEMIYQELAGRLALSTQEAAALMAEEIAVETQVLVRRETMVRIFKDAVATGKPVYLLSDMYLGREILSKILQAKGISGYRDLIVSCDVGLTKRSGELFTFFRNRAGGGSFLHIGDDPVADLEAPNRLGFKTFPVASGYEMLLASPFTCLLSLVTSPSDALALGMVVARAFNDPFLFYRTEGRLRIAAGTDLGYLAYGALTTAVLQWLIERTAGLANATILFGARDGYLFHRLYLRVVEALGKTGAARSAYFLTSRRAVTVPSLHNRQDILTLLQGVAGQPSYREILETRFGVAPAVDDLRANQCFDCAAMDDLRAFVLDYEGGILCNAAAECAAYQSYVASLNLAPEGELFFFDLITSGTIPHFLPHVLGREPVCLCVLMNRPPKYDLPAGFSSFLSPAGPYERSHHFVRGHYLAESIFTAPDPELCHFDLRGEPVGGNQDDSHCKFDSTTPVREGITDFVETFLAIAGQACQTTITPQLADEMIGLVLSEECLVDAPLKADFVVSDRFTFMPALDPWLTIPAPQNELAPGLTPPS